MLNSSFKFLLIIVFVSSSYFAFGQCSTCQPDTMCVPDVMAPWVCPEIMPNATSGEYYEEVMTFYLPTNFDDPGTGQNVTINQVVITNVTGLPYGIDYTLNNADFTYYPSEGENFGCTTVCGTPLLAGVYDVTITAHVFVEVLGFSLEVDQVFVNTLIVDQGEEGNNSFIVDVNAGCGSVEANFTALINSTDQPTDWAWDFANGNTSEEQNPPTQVYNEAGDYTVSLTTQLWNYTLNEINLIGLGGNWAGDIEEPIESLANPDPYFVVKDSLDNIIFTSDVVNNSFSHTWSNLGIVLSNPPYSVEFYDDDNISADDFLASFPLDIAIGYQNFDDTQTNGLFLVELVNSDTFYDEEVIHVFAEPTYEFVVNEDNNSITIVGDNSLTGFVWTLNGEVQSTVDSIISMDEGGIYSCVVSNTFGCQLQSEEYIHCPEFTPQYDEMSSQLIAPEGFLSYQWYLDGLPMDGETNFFLENPTEGNYAVEVETDYGCEVQSEWLIFTGIEEMGLEENLTIFPNPVTDFVQVAFENSYNTIELFTIGGQMIATYNVQGKKMLKIDASKLEQGDYFLVFKNDKISRVKKIIKL